MKTVLTKKRVALISVAFALIVGIVILSGSYGISKWFESKIAERAPSYSSRFERSENHQSVSPPSNSGC